LSAAGAPLELVQLAPGYAEAGKALVEQSDKAGLGRMGWRFFSILEMYNISNV
jgi:hypothetical protein